MFMHFCAYSMDMVLNKLKVLMEEQGKEVAELPPCVDLEISLLR